MRIKQKKTTAAAILAMWLIPACSSDDKQADATNPTTTTTTVGATGGEVTRPGAKISVPEGALAADVAIGLRAISAPTVSGVTIAGQAFEFTPAGTTFAKPVQVELDMTGVAGFDAAATNHAVYWSKPGDTTQFDIVPHTREGNIFRFSVTHFSIGFVGVPQPVVPADPPPPPKLVVTFRPDSARPVWFAAKLGDGNWAPRTLPQNGIYQTDLNEARFGVAWVCASTEPSAPKSVHVIYGVQASPNVITDGCETPGKQQQGVPGTFLMSKAPSAANTGYFVHAGGYTQTYLPQTRSFQFLNTVTTDDFMAIARGNASPGVLALAIKRNVTATNGIFEVSFDLSSEGVNLGTQYKMTVPSTAFINTQSGYNPTGISYVLRGHQEGLSVSTENFSVDSSNGNKRRARYLAIPASAAHPDDRYQASAETPEVNGVKCKTQYAFKTAKDFELTFIGAPANVSSRSQTVGTRQLMTATWTPGADATRHGASWSQYSGNSGPLRYEVIAASPWFADATRTLSMPDLSGVAGFNAAWSFKADSDVYLEEVVDSKISTPAAGEQMEQMCKYSDLGNQ